MPIRQQPPADTMRWIGARWYLRVLSWNVHALPFALGRRARLERVANVILRELPDAVQLQEVWAPRDWRYLNSRLAPRYELVEVPARNLLFRQSGLVTLVRQDWQVEGVASHTFSVRAPSWRVWEADALSNKGVLAVRISRGGRRVVLYNTHLQAEYEESRYEAIRAAQLAELSDFVERLSWNPPFVLTGDLNTRPDEHAVLRGLLSEWIDLGHGFRERCECSTQIHGDGRKGAWVDYALARPSEGGRTRAVEFDLITNDGRDQPYSDHEGISATVEMLEPGAGTVPLIGLLITSPAPMSRRTFFGASLLAWLDWRGRL